MARTNYKKAMFKQDVIKVEAPTPRNALLVAMTKRYGKGVQTHKDRRLPRGGNQGRERHFEGW